jgi:glutamate transport system permease protein
VDPLLDFAEPVLDNLDLYATGLWTTLRICLWSAFLALSLGTVIAACRVSPVPPLRRFGSGWVLVLRNTPLTVVFFFVAFGLPEIGVNGEYYWFAVAALSLYTSSFVAEALRSGVNAVPTGQAEAARAIGLTFGQSLGQVILPQAFRTSVPPLVNVLIAMVKNSATAGFFGVAGDLSWVGDTLTSGRGYAVIPVLLGVVIGFWILVLPAGALLSVVERKVAVVR